MGQIEDAGAAARAADEFERHRRDRAGRVPVGRSVRRSPRSGRRGFPDASCARGSSPSWSKAAPRSPLALSPTSHDQFPEARGQGDNRCVISLSGGHGRERGDRDRTEGQRRRSGRCARSHSWTSDPGSGWSYIEALVRQIGRTGNGAATTAPACRSGCPIGRAATRRRPRADLIWDDRPTRRVPGGSGGETSTAPHGFRSQVTHSTGRLEWRSQPVAEQLENRSPGGPFSWASSSALPSWSCFTTPGHGHSEPQPVRSPCNDWRQPPPWAGGSGTGILHRCHAAHRRSGAGGFAAARLAAGGPTGLASLLHGGAVWGAATLILGWEAPSEVAAQPLARRRTPVASTTRGPANGGRVDCAAGLLVPPISPRSAGPDSTTADPAARTAAGWLEDAGPVSVEELRNRDNGPRSATWSGPEEQHRAMNILTACLDGCAARRSERQPAATSRGYAFRRSWSAARRTRCSRRRIADQVSDGTGRRSGSWSPRKWEQILQAAERSYRNRRSPR